MKKTAIVLGIIATVILFIFSCDKLTSDHPQAGLETTGGKQPGEAEIRAYADSVNLLLAGLEKRESLVYSIGDRSFHITKYMDNGEPLLYIENGDNGSFEKIIKKYYLKNGRLMLYTIDTRAYDSPAPYRSERLYFRNNILFYAEQKKAADSASLKAKSYAEVKPGIRDPRTGISLMEDAIRQRGDFDLVFNGITEYPRARYLVLSRDDINAYRAVIRVEKDDELITELAGNPSRYTGARLDINWHIGNGGEAVYESGRVAR